MQMQSSSTGNSFHASGYPNTNTTKNMFCRISASCMFTSSSSTFGHPEHSSWLILRGEWLQITGEITYNGVTFKGFIPQRTAAYIEQVDLHLPELTVRETMNFAARVQGVGHKAGQNSMLAGLPCHMAEAKFSQCQDAIPRALR